MAMSSDNMAMHAILEVSGAATSTAICVSLFLTDVFVRQQMFALIQHQQTESLCLESLGFVSSALVDVLFVFESIYRFVNTSLFLTLQKS